MVMLFMIVMEKGGLYMVKESNVRIMVTLTKDELEILERVSEKLGLTKSGIIKVLIREKMKKWNTLFKV